MATSSESRLGASVNGDLEDRVQQLRLDDQLGAGKTRGGGSWLPWVLCGLLALTWVGVGVRWYRTAPEKGEEAPTATPDIRAYQLALGNLKKAEEKLKRMQADLEAKKPGATPEKVKESSDEVDRLKKELPPDPQAAGAGTVVTQLKGIVIPSLQVNLSPRDVAAEITELYFAEGTRVKKGDRLATLLDHQYANQLKTQEAAVKSAEAQLSRAIASEASASAKVAKSESGLAAAKAHLTRAVAQKNRAQKDFEQAEMQNASGTISTQDYQMYKANKLSADADKIAADADVVTADHEIVAAKADLNTATASVTAAKADLEAAKARCLEAERLVKNCVVLAPIDGTILTKTADKGTLVSPMSFNVAAGICTMADLSKLEVEIEVPERQITRLKTGQDCLLQADADPNRPYRGVVDRVMPIADDTKNVVKVRIRAYLHKNEKQGSFLHPKNGVTVTVYERKFEVNPDTDFLWGDEKERVPAWEAEWKK